MTGMIATIEIPAETHRRIAADLKAAANFPAAVSGSLQAAASIGTDRVREQLNDGSLGLRTSGGAAGLSAALSHWTLSADSVAIGVRANSPAAAYASIHEFGGRILPVNAKALAIPLSDEAKGFTSPRDQANLTMISRKGRPPLLVEILSARGARHAQWRIHWVLVPSVDIPARRWLSRGVTAAAGRIGDAFSATFWRLMGWT